MSPKIPKKKKASTPISPGLRRHLIEGLVAICCCAAVIATGLFIRQALIDIDAPAESGNGTGVRIEGVDQTLLDAVIEKNASRRADARALPAETHDPFARPRPQTTAPVVESEAAQETTPDASTQPPTP